MFTEVDRSRSWYAWSEIACWFLLGGLVTAPFSLSLSSHAVNASFGEVALTGMLVPCFTWVVQFLLVMACLPSPERQRYAVELGRVCFWGSVALLPGSLINFLQLPQGLLGSAVNVLASVCLMAWLLFRAAKRLEISAIWPIGWCITIVVNMGLFVFSSRHWWGS